MKKTHVLVLLLFALMFLFTGIWKSNLTDSGPAGVVQEERPDRSTLQLFWDHYNRASAYLNDGNYADAAESYEDALLLNDTHEGALYYLGSSRLLLREFEAAEHHWNRLISRNPNSARGHLQLGTLYFCLADGNPLFDPEQAEERFMRAHDLYREETGPPLQLAKISLLKNSPEQAGELLDIVLAANFMNYQALFLLAFLDWSKGGVERGHELLANAGERFDSISQVAMAGEGATSAGFRPMLSDDMYCDFIGIRIGELLTGRQDDSDEARILSQFEDDLKRWREETSVQSITTGDR